MPGGIGYLIVVLLPAIVATVGQRHNNGLLPLAVTVSGVVAYAIVTMQFVLTARIKWIMNSFGNSSTLRLHKSMAIAATLFAVAHIALLVSSRGNWKLLLNPLASWPIQLGRIAALSLPIILAISFGRKLLPINNSDWRWFHNALAWLILISGFVHGMVMGTSFDNSIFATIWIGYFLIAILAWAHGRKVRLERR